MMKAMKLWQRCGERVMIFICKKSQKGQWTSTFVTLFCGLIYVKLEIYAMYVNVFISAVSRKKRRHTQEPIAWLAQPIYTSNAILHNSVVCKSLCTVTWRRRRRKIKILGIQWSRWDELIWYCLSLSTTEV